MLNWKPVEFFQKRCNMTHFVKSEDDEQNSSQMSGCLIRIAWLDLLGGNLNEGGENISQS